MEPQRGEIWWVQLDPTRGSEVNKTRPAVVISALSLARLPVRIIVPITSWQPKFATRPTMIPISASSLNGLNNNLAADTLQIRCVSIERITQRIGIIDPNQLDAIVEGVALCIDYK